MAALQVLAHEGGWDEILMVAGPLAVIAVLLWLANRRVSAKLAEAEAESSGDGSDQPTEIDRRPSADPGQA